MNMNIYKGPQKGLYEWDNFKNFREELKAGETYLSQHKKHQIWYLDGSTIHYQVFPEKPTEERVSVDVKERRADLLKGLTKLIQESAENFLKEEKLFGKSYKYAIFLYPI